jgi:putative NADH-flavin reductase
VARALIVGCGCRGRTLAAELLARGHAVRGTSRTPEGVEAIGAAGLEAARADPDRLGTVMAAIDGVSVVVWLMGSAEGPGAEDVNGPRLETMLERVVDTPARGFVLEAPEGPAGERAVDLAEAAAVRWRMPVEVVRADPADHAGWTVAAAAAVDAVLDSGA